MSEMVRDPVNRMIIEIKNNFGVAQLGLHVNKQWHEDPKHLLFSMSRYKFVAKMLNGSRSALEIGCGDAFSSRLVRQEVQRLKVVDIDPLFIADVNKRFDAKWPVEALVHDMTEGPLSNSETFDAVYSLDVLEHIEKSREKKFLDNACKALDKHGVMIIGMPTIESQAYSKPASETGHINCKSGPELKKLMEEYFHNVFSFSMNDEVVHTGHHKMAHYIFAVCCGAKG